MDGINNKKLGRDFNLIDYITHNLIRMVLLIILLCIITFFMSVNSPIDPIRQLVEPGVTLSLEQREAISDYWGVNDTKFERLQKWIFNIFRGDFGKSLIFRKNVSDVIFERAVNSIFLMGSSFFLSGLLGYILGLIMGRYMDSIADNIIKTVCIILSATPVFWVGILMLMIFSVKLNIFPIGFSVPIGVSAEDVNFYEKIYHGILPIITLSIAFTPNIALHTRSKTIEVLQSDYILFAKAKGEKSIIKNHVIKNTAIPAITILFGSFSELFAGSILAENVFSYPGLGSTIVNAGLGGDIPLLLGITIITGIFVFVGNFIADILCMVMNPMIREERL